MNLQILPLKLRDTDLVMELNRAGFSDTIYPLTIFSSEKYGDYLEATLSIPENLRRKKVYGAYFEDQLLGYSEWTIEEDGLHLQNISVLPSCRGLNIGKKLLIQHGYQLMKIHRKTKIVLDVFEENISAIKWYESCGFEKESSNYWYVSEQPKTKRLDNPTVENYPQAEAVHLAYGFSELSVQTFKGKYQVTRLNENLYRMTDSNTYQNQDLLYLLKRLDRKRQLLVISEKPNRSEAELQGISCRMSLHLKNMLKYMYFKSDLGMGGKLHGL
ncbi:GNAT family N-acetyltransferase [Thalassobacillus hwangdonensis]|uniref:GNAT family N-acetyltransferase n=1 Tax=Thalassobacillus hwangdonensis TaxID=546108 RepID=A0ABW3L2G3_9BACI